MFPALQYKNGCFRTDVLLQRMAVASGAKNPSPLAGTRLRKQVATMVQFLNLRDHKKHALAKFLGHTIEVEFQFYQLNDSVIELAKISKLLMNLEQGKIAQMKGPNVNEIELKEAHDWSRYEFS